ncbi:MAG: LytTR family DNA-binding domain-containing protein [Bacteroidota bacterium]
MMLNCLIVDDEPPAHKVLENYIGKINSLQLLGNCYNAIDAINFLHENHIDILFLDINMPELSGLEMLKTLQKPPLVILTTAYSEFALESYEFGVVDYLLKPIRFDRFLKSVNKVLQMKSPAAKTLANESKPSASKATSFFVKADGVKHKVFFDDIHYIESKGNFVQLHLKTNRLLTAETLSNMDKKLGPHGFLRVHKSFIINTKKVKSIQGNQIQIGDRTVPIGNSYRQMVHQRIG